jgi:hypothetical protein
MAYEQRDNGGSLFKNDRKESEKHPDYKGTAKINGQDFWMNAWLKEKNGKKFFSFSFNAKDARQAARSTPPPETANEPEDESIPF